MATQKFTENASIETRYLYALLLFIWSYYPTVPLDIVFTFPVAILRSILSWLGFRKDGVTRDTWAARYQSEKCGGYIPAGGSFAASQSWAMREQEETRERWQGLLACLLGWALFFAAAAVLHGDNLVV